MASHTGLRDRLLLALKLISLVRPRDIFNPDVLKVDNFTSFSVLELGVTIKHLFSFSISS